jgi:predicted dehydrogenase
MLNLTRRQFTAATIAAAASPMFLSSRARAGGGPNGKIGLGFIGLGIQGRDHLSRFIKDPAVYVVGVCDVDTTRREFSKKMVDEAYGNTDCKEFIDFNELLAMGTLDAVLIATPDHWHAAPVIAAAKARKDIYCEKPLSETLLEAKLMMDAVRANGVVFQTGSQQRTEYDGQFRTAVEHVRNGRLGKIYAVHVGVPTRGPGITVAVPCDLPEETLEPGLDWDRWLGPAPKRPYNSILAPRGINKNYPDWRLYREYGGGMITDFGAHHFDIAQWGLDMDESGPVEVVPPKDEKVVFGARLVYASGIEVIHCGPTGITFVGDRGMIHVDRGFLRSDPDNILKEVAPGKKEADEVKFPRPANHHADWIECIKSRSLPICDVEVGARTVACCHLVNLAYQHRKTMKWDPAKWEFVGDVSMNAWMDRERRKGYELPA